MKSKKTLAVIASVVIFLVGAINAYSDTVGKNRSEYIGEFISNSPEYKSINGNIQKNILTAYSAENRLTDIERQIEDSERQLASYREQYSKSGKQSERESIQLNIDIQIISGFDLQVTKAQYQTQYELQKLYQEYSPLIQKQQEDILKYQVIQKLNRIKLYEAQINHLEAVAELKEKEITVEMSRLQAGYSRQADVDVLVAESATINASKMSAEIELDTIIFELKKNIIADTIEFEHDYSITEFSAEYDKYISEFNEQGYYTSYTQAEVKIYEGYLKELSDILIELKTNNPEKAERDFPVNGDISDYYNRTISNIESETAYYTNEIELKNLSLKQGQQELEVYVYGLCGQYTALLSQLEAKELEISAAQALRDISSALFEQGRVIEINVIAADVQVKSLEFERLQLMIQLDEIVYLLENCISNK